MQLVSVRWLEVVRSVEGVICVASCLMAYGLVLVAWQGLFIVTACRWSADLVLSVSVWQPIFYRNLSSRLFSCKWQTEGLPGWCLKVTSSYSLCVHPEELHHVLAHAPVKAHGEALQGARTGKHAVTSIGFNCVIGGSMVSL